jgi:hypothetical protein
MLKKNAAIVLAALLLSAILLTTSGSTFQSARAQTNNTGGLFGTLANFRDQTVKGGNHVVDQITKGGAGFLNGIAASLPNTRVHFDTTYQDIVKDDKTGAGTQLKELYADFVNDSQLTYGLGEELTQIAQNNSAHVDSHTKQILSAIGTDLKGLALGSGKINSTSNSTGANNSTQSK